MQRSLALLGVLASFAAAPVASAQDYPTRPVTIVVPFAAGGAADVGARLFGQHLAERLGKGVARSSAYLISQHVYRHDALELELDLLFKATLLTVRCDILALLPTTSSPRKQTFLYLGG